MRTREDALVYGLSFPELIRKHPSMIRIGSWCGCRAVKRRFYGLMKMDGLIHLNVKVDPQWRDFWRDAYEAVLPGYHQNKEHWNTIRLDRNHPGCLMSSG